MFDHSAGAQLLGYLYQIWYALYLILERNEPNLAIRIEDLDDIDVWEEDKLRALLQGKHHLDENATLSDRSRDLWGTIRIWSEHVKEAKIYPSETTLTLFTTAKVPEGSIASYLLPLPHRRDPRRACQQLRKQTKKPAKELQKGFDAFMNLLPEQQEELVNAIQILERSPNILELQKKIADKLIAVHPEHMEKVLKEFEGWWINKIIEHLMNNSLTLIKKNDVRRQLASINDRHKISLPDNWLHEKAPDSPDDSGMEWTDMRFVRQLAAIDVDDETIELAIEDYWRAFKQRTEWQTVDSLVTEKELTDYEKKLKDEWKCHRSHLKNAFSNQENCSIDQASEQQLKKFGSQLYQKIDEDVEIPIRPDFTAKYLTRGSYHYLAEKLEQEDSIPYLRPVVWWHPKFPERNAQ